MFDTAATRQDQHIKRLCRAAGRGDRRHGGNEPGSRAAACGQPIAFQSNPIPKPSGVEAPGHGVLYGRSWRRGRLPARRPPAAHLHMISWVSSTRHISGFLSWPSYTMACPGTSRGGDYQAPRLWPPVAPDLAAGRRQVHSGQGRKLSPPRPPSWLVTQSEARPKRPPLQGALPACTGFQLSRRSRGPGQGQGAGSQDALASTWAHQATCTALGPSPQTIVYTEFQSSCWKRPLRTRCN